MAKKVETTNYGKQCAALGYDLFIHARDTMGNYHKYMTSPANGGGANNFFKSLDGLRRWIGQVENIRAMAELSDDEWSRRQSNIDYIRMNVAPHAFSYLEVEDCGARKETE